MKSYLKFLSRNKLYTAIEAAGLIVSLALVLIIGMWVRDQLGLAGNKAGENQLYLLSQKEESMTSRMVYRDIDALRNYPEIQQVAAFIPVSVTVGNGEKRRKMNVRLDRVPVEREWYRPVSICCPPIIPRYGPGRTSIDNWG